MFLWFDWLLYPAAGFRLLALCSNWVMAIDGYASTKSTLLEPSESVSSSLGYSAFLHIVYSFENSMCRIKV